LSYCPLPSGVSEAQVVAAIDAVSTKLAKAFSFGNYAPQDIAQEVAVFSMELLRKGTYEASRPLEPYLLTHARNRLCNLKRNLHHRSDSPCPRCASGKFCCEPGPCQKHAKWADRNRTKANLNRPADLGGVPPDREPMTSESEVDRAVEGIDLEQLIDERLDLHLRADYLRLKGGEVVHAHRRRLVQEAILDILDDAGLPLDGLEVN
jgi:hypothetical protein